MVSSFSFDTMHGLNMYVVHIVSIEIPTADIDFEVKVLILFRHKNSVLM